MTVALSQQWLKLGSSLHSFHSFYIFEIFHNKTFWKEKGKRQSLNFKLNRVADCGEWPGRRCSVRTLLSEITPLSLPPHLCPAFLCPAGAHRPLHLLCHCPVSIHCMICAECR